MRREEKRSATVRRKHRIWALASDWLLYTCLHSSPFISLDSLFSLPFFVSLSISLPLYLSVSIINFYLSLLL